MEDGANFIWPLRIFKNFNGTFQEVSKNSKEHQSNCGKLVKFGSFMTRPPKLPQGYWLQNTRV